MLHNSTSTRSLDNLRTSIWGPVMRHCSSIVWCTQTTILMVSKRRQLHAARGVRHVAHDQLMPAIAIILRRWITLSPDYSNPPKSGRCAVSASLARFPPDRSRFRLHNESRQRKSRACQQTCSLPIAAVRVAALFRCTLNPVVLQSRNLETSFPTSPQVLLQC